MHPSVMTWVAQVVVDNQLAGRDVLEVGSLNVNGSVRPLFDTDDYVGVDIRPGPGVDRVVDPGNLPYPECSFDVVVSTEVLEHDPRPWLTIREASRVLRRGGHLLITCRGIGFPRHDHPSDYWRVTTDGMAELLAWAELDPVDIVEDPDLASPGVFAHAVKAGL